MVNAAADVPEQSEALNLGKKRTSNNNDSEDEHERGDMAAADGDAAAHVSAVKRIKTEPRSSPPRGYSSGDEAKTSDAGSPPPTAADVIRYASDARRGSSPVDEDVVEMDINTSPTAGEYHGGYARLEIQGISRGEKKCSTNPLSVEFPTEQSCIGRKKIL